MIVIIAATVVYLFIGFIVAGIVTNKHNDEFEVALVSIFWVCIVALILIYFLANIPFKIGREVKNKLIGDTKLIEQLRMRYCFMLRHQKNDINSCGDFVNYEGKKYYVDLSNNSVKYICPVITLSGLLARKKRRSNE